MSVHWKKVGWFLGLAFSLSWSLAGVFYALGGRLGSVVGVAMAVAYMFTPLTAALLTQKIYNEPVIGPLGIHFRLNWWWLFASLLVVVMAFVTFGVGLLLPGTQYDPTMSGYLSRVAENVPPEAIEQAREQIGAVSPILVLLISAAATVVAAYTANGIAGFGEEAGWRGLLLRELAPLGFWKSTALIGVIWGIWHAPLILQGHNYPNYPVLGVGMMTIFTLLLSPIITYVRLHARSVFGAAIFHGAINASIPIQIIYISGGDELTIGPTGIAGFIVMALTIAAIVIYDRKLSPEPILDRQLAEVVAEKSVDTSGS